MSLLATNPEAYNFPMIGLKVCTMDDYAGRMPSFRAALLLTP
jgi:hypothetical protein